MSNLEKIEKIYPLSNMQVGMLFHALLDKQSQAYFEQMSFTLYGDIDVELFGKSFNILIQRYDILRTNFVYENLQRPRQIVFKGKNLKVDFHDLSIWNESEKQTFIEEYKYKDKEKGFDLTKDLLIRLSILQTGAKSYEVIWSFHHILMDGWCIGIIIKEFLQIYQSLRENQPINLEKVTPYSKFITWLEKQEKEDAEYYWKRYLANYEERVSIPKKNSPQKTGYLQKNFSFTFEEELSRKLEQIASNNKVTLNTILQSIWGILLQKYNNVDDVVFGAVVSGRPSEIVGIEKMVGLFINTIPVRIQNQGQQAFGYLIKQVQKAALESEKYSYLSLAEIQANAKLKQELIDQIIVFENYPVEREITELNTDSLGFQIGGVEVFEQTNYDLNVIVGLGKELVINLKFNELVYDEETIQRLRKHFQAIVKAIVNNESLLPNEIEMITAEEKQKILYDFNNTRADYSRDKTIRELFEAQVARNQDNVAIAYEDQEISYGELNRKANQLARVLKDKGIGADSIVGIMMKRSPEFVVGILGIIKAGGAFAPIDPEYPIQRILYIQNNSKIAVLITEKENFNTISENICLENIILIDRLLEVLPEKSDENLICQIKPEDLLYIIYTSGSTGEPKGVMIEHKNIVNLINFEYQGTKLDFSGKVLQFTTTCFDVCYQEIFSTLLAGGELYIVNEAIKREPIKLFQYIKDNQISIIFLPTSYLKFILNEKTYIQHFPNFVQHIITAGEQLIITEPFKAYLTNNKVTLHNHYGPSETHVVTTYSINQENEITSLPPIGKPIYNNRIYILNQDQKLQPIGVTGELCIGGDGVGRGYLNRPELTAEKFVPDPFVPGEKMYRTGDLARWLPDGNIEFLGRMDHQVKIRGFRIELGEIENQLLRNPLIQETVVIANKDNSGDNYLCAYIVAERELTVQELREYLAQELPDYMIPSYFLQLDKLPLTPNGKIDRKALPESEGNIQTGVEYEAPRNEIEEKLAAIWQEILGVEKIGINDNFFELGGHSLNATTVVSRIYKELNVEMPLRELFQTPTIKGLAEYIQRAESNLYAAIEPVEKQEYYPVSSAQKRLYIISQMEDTQTDYNIPGVLTFEGKLDRERLKTTFQELVRRHETLRTSFPMVNGEPVQQLHERVDFAVQVQEVAETEVETIIKNFIYPFDLSCAPLLRVGVIKISETKHILLFDMHHIISDGASIAILVREFVKLYQGEKLPELRIQYKDYSAWQNRLLRSGQIKKQEEYWLGQYQGEIPILNLPTDYPRRTDQHFRGDRLSFKTGEGLTNQLHQLANAGNTTLFMVLFAAFNVLLSKWTGQEDIIVGTPIAGRRHADLESIVGVFINLLVIRSHPVQSKTFIQFLTETKENLLEAYDNQDYQFEMLLDKLNLPRGLNRTSLFNVVFNMLNMAEDSVVDFNQIGDQDLTVEQYKYDPKISKYDLELYVSEVNDQLFFNCVYRNALFKKATIEPLTTSYVNILNEIAANFNIVLLEIEKFSEEKNYFVQSFNDDLENDLVY
jgi:amino acid adenylation domain-containing protein